MYDINDTITDIPSMLQQVASASSFFGAGVIIFIWAFIALTGYFAQDRRTGRGSMPMWLTIGGFFSTLISFILFLMDGIISLPVVSSTLIIFIVCAGWFLFSGND